MQLLDRYLQAVRQSLLLMSRARKDDVVAEIGDHLRSEMEERELTLGRPLSDAERKAILLRYGHPWLVASRYRADRGTLSFGAVLIGPEVFPYYLAILGLNLAVTVGLCLVLGLVALAGGEPLSRVALSTIRWPGLALPLLVQAVAVTAIFAGVETWKRRWMDRADGGGFTAGWAEPPSPSRRRAVAGIVGWSVAAGLWAFGPLLPALLLGLSVTDVAVGPAWASLFAPVMALLAACVVQRAVFLSRPDLAGFHTGMRLAVNALALIVLYGVRDGDAFVVAASTAANPVRAQHLAQAFNAVVLRGLLSWIWIVLGVMVLAHAATAVTQLRDWLRERGSAAPANE